MQVAADHHQLDLCEFEVLLDGGSVQEGARETIKSMDDNAVDLPLVNVEEKLEKARSFECLAA